MHRTIRRRHILLILLVSCFAVFSAGCAEQVVEQAEEQYDRTIGEANRSAVDASLTAINSSVRIYAAANAGSPSIEDLLGSGLLSSWPSGPDSVTYELADSNGKTVAVAVKNSAGSWWTAADERVSSPVKW